MRKWFVLAVTTLLASVCLAQTNPSANKEQAVPIAPVKQEPNKAPIPKFSMSMFEGDRIDPGYSGVRVVDVVDAIGKLIGQRQGEFESTADFNSRKAAALSGRILGDSSIEDTFAFVLPVGKGGQYNDGLKYNFNADTSEVRLFVLPKSSSMNGIGAPDSKTNRRENSGLDQFDLESKMESQSTYQGSNAYGATVTVEKSLMSRVGIAANRISFLNFKRDRIYSNPVAAGQFNLENAKAARELPALQALVVMKLADPYLVYDFQHKEPKRDSPTEIMMLSKYLSGSILGIVFYSGITGEIFLRLPERFGRPDPKAELDRDDKLAGR